MSADTNPTQAVPESSTAPTSALFGDEQSAMFDELPAYKSVVPTAVAAPVFGLISILSFTSGYFLIFSVLAIVCALLAFRQIKKFPERSTGAPFARVGLAMGLVFMLASLTITGTQWLLRIKAAGDFAKQYAQVIANGTPEEIIFFHGTPEGREGKPPAQVVEEMKKAMPNPGAFDSMTRPLYDVLALLKTPGHTITYDGLEGDGVDGMRTLAIARLKIAGPGNAQHPGPEQFLLVRMNAHNVNGRLVWMVDEFRFPYKAKTGIPRDNFVP